MRIPFAITEQKLLDIREACTRELKAPKYDTGWQGKRKVCLQVETIIELVDKALYECRKSVKSAVGQ